MSRHYHTAPGSDRLGHVHLVAAGPLGNVLRLVDGLHERIHGPAIAGERGHSHAEGHSRDYVSTQDERIGFDRPPQTLGGGAEGS